MRVHAIRAAVEKQAKAPPVPGKPLNAQSIAVVEKGHHKGGPMPFEHLNDGLYLIKQRSATKAVDHYGILDVGNRLRLPNVLPGQQPVVIHQSPPQVQLVWLQQTGSWEVLGQITDEGDAIARIHNASQNPQYNLIGHNCEHFARYVATGKRESHQVQIVAVIAGLAALAFVR